MSIAGYGTDHPEGSLTRVLQLLAEARAATQSRDQQRALLERAVQCLTNGLGPRHSMTLEARALLDEVSVSLN